MAGNRVDLDSRGVQALLNDAGVAEHLRERAERVLAAAQASAPVATGAYRESLHIETATTDRAVVRVVASAAHAPLVESRTGNLSRALTAGGGE